MLRNIKHVIQFYINFLKKDKDKILPNSLYQNENILSRHLHPLLKRPYIFIISSHVKGLSLHEGMNDSETKIVYDDIQIQNNTKDCIVLIVRFNYS